ncbi:MAG: hypothetical protein CMN79_01065 [Spirochaetales bacterium]|jgi:hypothetical protein|nr:hypothetical protein [Spirochaetales bacterium]|tara:strand:+ start:451 stop:654 length:204 start_codon:yes stop_codon:yes gene_type:complete
MLKTGLRNNWVVNVKNAQIQKQKAKAPLSVKEKLSMFRHSYALKAHQKSMERKTRNSLFANIQLGLN